MYSSKSNPPATGVPAGSPAKGAGGSKPGARPAAARPAAPRPTPPAPKPARAAPAAPAAPASRPAGDSTRDRATGGAEAHTDQTQLSYLSSHQNLFGVDLGGGGSGKPGSSKGGSSKDPPHGGAQASPAGDHDDGLAGEPQVEAFGDPEAYNRLINELDMLMLLASTDQRPETLMSALDEARALVAELRPRLGPAWTRDIEGRLQDMQDLVLAALQRHVVASAEREEQAGVGEGDQTGRDRILEYIHGIGWGTDAYERPSDHEIVYDWTDHDAGTSGTTAYQWCGAFAGYNYVETAGLDPDLSMAFSSAPSLSSFFRYRGHRDPDAIQIDGEWVRVSEYHEARGSVREWWDANRIAELVSGGGWAALPIRRGDVVIIDHRDGGNDRDHVAMVQSWDPGTGTLVTIDGNSYHESVQDGIDRSNDLSASATGHPSSGDRIYGIGRPSIVDFEVHTYRDHMPEPPDEH